MHSQSIPQRVKHGVQCGYSLIELTLVVLILGIMAAAVIPSFFSPDPNKLDAAAEVNAEGMRFARSEAMRRSEPIGFRQQNGQKRMRVYSLDTGTTPWTIIYDVYHPVTKKLWDIKLDEHPFAAADAVTANRVFRGTCNTQSNVYFDANGIARCADPDTVPVELYEVTLTLGSESRTVSLNGFTGQVTIQ